MKKIQMSLTFDQETKERLRAYADEHRMSISQAITQWIWGVKLKSEQKQAGDD